MSNTPETDNLARGNHVVPTEWAEQLERERDEAMKTLTDIHRWIERNHPDGFLDSLTYYQNLERVTDNWYDRIDGIEADARRFVRERDEAREQNAKLRDIAESAIWRAVNGVCLPDASAVRVINEEGIRLRAKLEQLKEEVK
jgi:hypothetical protein